MQKEKHFRLAKGVYVAVAADCDCGASLYLMDRYLWEDQRNGTKSLSQSGSQYIHYPSMVRN